VSSECSVKSVSLAKSVSSAKSIKSAIAARGLAAQSVVGRYSCVSLVLHILCYYYYCHHHYYYYSFLRCLIKLCLNPRVLLFVILLPIPLRRGASKRLRGPSCRLPA